MSLVRDPQPALPLASKGAESRPNVIGMTRPELAAALVGLGERPASAPMRVRQLWHWLYYRGAPDFSEMTTLAKTTRARLTDAYVIRRPEATRALESADGTRKWLVKFDDGQEVETVHIPEADRGALCISSQVGCTLTCAFCHTGTQKLVRNVTAAEIVGQILIARDALGEWPTPKSGRMLSNIVMMGMGEPLLNYDNVAKALTIAMDGEGIALSRRRITLSTAGIVPMIERCGRELGVNLAISLHAVTDELRDQLVPINRKYPLRELLAAARAYPGANNARRITFEYVMLDGVNDGQSDARALARLLRGIPAKVNLIPFNPWPGAPFRSSNPVAIQAFAEIINAAGYSAPVRVSRGQDILAACGQLKSASVRLSRRAARAKTEIAEGGAAPSNPT